MNLIYKLGLFFLLTGKISPAQIHYFAFEDQENKYCALMALDLADQRNCLLEFMEVKRNNLTELKEAFKYKELQRFPNIVQGSRPNTYSIYSLHNFYGPLGELMSFLFFDYHLKDNQVVLFFDKEDSRFVLTIPAEMVLQPF